VLSPGGSAFIGGRGRHVYMQPSILRLELHVHGWKVSQPESHVYLQQVPLTTLRRIAGRQQQRRVLDLNT
jgi:hypothetical protein